MDLLTVANDINAELVHIQLQYNDVFDQQSPADIFNSIVSCITDDLAETITLQIVDQHDPACVLLSWEYDLQDRQYPRRIGPGLAEILLHLKKLPQKSAHLVCTAQWSPHFQALDAPVQERFLRQSIWGKKRSIPQDIPTRSEDPSGSAFAAQAVDISLLQEELSQLATETQLINLQEADAICESAQTSRAADHIQGIHCELAEHGKRPALEWEYVFSPEGKLLREGASFVRILSVARALQGQSGLVTRPVQTASFKKLPAKIQQEVMKDTVWASMVKRKGLLSWQ
ncbi:MAG TPA: hypothetical protein VGF67_07630 [Ktedonobacteraceae bacterium]|jgi:hypothetical protein